MRDCRRVQRIDQTWRLRIGATVAQPFAQLQTGRRSEGLFFASTSLLGKLVAGLGVTIASFVLTIAGLKAGADPTQVSPESIWRLGALYVPTVLGLWLAMLGALSFYKLTRSDHEANLAALEARRLME